MSSTSKALSPLPLSYYGLAPAAATRDKSKRYSFISNECRETWCDRGGSDSWWRGFSESGDGEKGWLVGRSQTPHCGLMMEAFVKVQKLWFSYV